MSSSSTAGSRSSSGTAASGALIASRHPRNAIGWLFCAIATGFSVTAFADEFVTRGLATGSDFMLVPLAWLNSWAFVIPLVACRWCSSSSPTGAHRRLDGTS